MLSAPCKDCKDRFVGCHVVCLKYIDYRQKMDVFRKENRQRTEQERINTKAWSVKKKW